MTRRYTGSKRRRSPCEAGFTLLETLIAMTLLGMMTVVIAAGLRTGTRVWERGEAHAQAADDIRTVQAVIHSALSAAYPYLVARSGEDPFIDFDGQAQSLTFLAPAPAAMAPGGRARITLQANGSDFVMKARPELRHPDTDSERLLCCLATLAFAYYGGAASDKEPQWQERWTGRLALPTLIRVSVTFPPGDARRWPELVVKPRIAADVSCVYDPLTHRCRGR